MRLFIGIELPAPVAAALAGYQDILRGKSGRGRFKRQENFHLTLKFLGEVPADRLTALNEALAKVAGNYRPFSLCLGKLGRFGGESAPRVIWLDVDGDIKCLRLLQQEIEQAMTAEGFKPENRPWQPHITLAQDAELNGVLPWGKCPLPRTAFTVKEFCLILSEQQGGRRVYTPLYHLPLKASQA